MLLTCDYNLTSAQLNWWPHLYGMKFHKLTLRRYPSEVKPISGDQIMMLIEERQQVCKAVIKAKGGYFKEPQIKNMLGNNSIFLFVT